MNVVRVRNVHRALPLALELLRVSGVRRESRNGPVWVSPQPVTTLYEEPMERVMFWPQRDANPFLHFFEQLWILGGRDDVASVSYFAKRMSSFSDDGDRLHGAYGRRARVGMPADVGTPFSDKDQLRIISDRLRDNKDERRAVLALWDSASDLGNPSKDVPCNLTCTFQVDGEDRLNLVVFNRSNDVVWGCYGANAVHFAAMLEYVALRSGYSVGTYHQISVNWHGYFNTYGPLMEKFQANYVDRAGEEPTGGLVAAINEPSPYETGLAEYYPLAQEGTDMDEWDRSLAHLLRYNGRAPTSGHYCDPFFEEVAIPMLRAHDAFRERKDESRYSLAIDALDKCRAIDWRVAAQEWIIRRWNKAGEVEV